MDKNAHERSWYSTSVLLRQFLVVKCEVDSLPITNEDNVERWCRLQTQPSLEWTKKFVGVLNR
jgi:hypothetical protein